MRLGRLAICVLVLCGAARRATAQADFVGARALGMGEALRANATGAEGPILNPAAMSLQRQYVIEGMYGIRIEDIGHHANVSVVDSVTARVAAGLFYTYIYSSPKLGFNWAGGRVENATITRTGHTAGLALSIALGDKFLIGANIKYLHLDTTAPLPMNTQPPTLTLDTVNGITFDLGMIVRLGDKFNIAAIGYNLWDHGSRESPLSLGVGLSFIPTPAFNINFDTVINFTGYREAVYNPDGSVAKLDSRVTARLGPGLEYLVAQKVPIRAGVVYDTAYQGNNSRGATYLTLGLGYLSTQFGVDLSYRVKVEAGLENFLMAGIKLFVN
jgi:hypothetical protein